MKGKRFERDVATRIRERFPHLASTIRRSIQSRAAEESDVTGLRGFWLECQDAAIESLNPVGKLEQAERDLRLSQTRQSDVAVAVTHRSGARSPRAIKATLRAADLFSLYSVPMADDDPNALLPVTVDFVDFLELVAPRFPPPSRPIRKVKR